MIKLVDRCSGEINFWDIPVLNDMCWGWKKILQCRDALRDHIVYRFGDGFNDSKLGFSTAKELFGHGQDAVTKAIVSLALKSLDQSPSLLAVTREIDRDGSALYKVNDTATTDVGVKHLFLSQQLNVKNPTRANLQDKAKEARDAAYSKISKAVLTIEKIDNEKRILEDELIKLNKTLSHDEYKNLKEKCDHLHEQVHAERAKESDLKCQITDKQLEHIKLKNLLSTI
nr:RNA-directed DNA polymerase, eukaryota, reverse transcriptase zinc-binding domain protein [Tanacetum cinerariifolium]